MPKDPSDSARRNLTSMLGRMVIPADSYAVVFLDMDLGSIMGGRPDRPIEVAATFEEAIRIAATNDDEEQVGIFNAKRTLLLWRYGHTDFTYPDDPANR